MRTRLCTTVSACVAVAALAAQQPDATPNPQQPTFRGGTNYVRVDMYATRNGVAVDDLKPEEIEIREDGVVQKIVNFEHVHIRGGTPDAVRVDPNTVAESRQAVADPRARVFVIFLDTLHTHFFGSVNMSSPLVRFIDKVLGPDDLVALMTPEMSARDLAFGRKTTVISNIVQNSTDWGQRGRIGNHDKKEELYDYCYPASSVAKEMKERRREKLTLDALEDLVTVMTGLREERKAVLTISEGWLEFKENDQLAHGPALDPGTAPPLPAGPLGNPRDVGRPGTGVPSDRENALAECEVDRAALGGMDDSDRLRQLAGEANRGNLSFYTVYPRGLVLFDDVDAITAAEFQKDDAANLSQRQRSLRYLADDTDGLAVVNTNLIDKGIDRIVADLSSYYLMSYYSTNTKADGKFHNIGVKVTRPGIQIRARHGYRAPTAADLRAASTTPTPPAVTATTKALSAAVINPNATFRVRASSWTAGGGSGADSRMWLVGEVDSRVRRQFAWNGGAQAEVTVVAPSGETVLSKKVDMPATDLTFALSVPDAGGVKPGEYSVRVRIRPQADPSAPVNDSARVQVADTPSPLGEAVLWRRGPTTGTKYVMTADPRFTRTERIRLELPTRATAPATAILLDRSGATINVPVQVSTRDEAGKDFKWIVVEGALAPLAPGDYAIQVDAEGTRQVTAFKVVP